MFNINLLDLPYLVCHLDSLYCFASEVLSVPQNHLEGIWISDSWALLPTYLTRVLWMAFLEASQIILVHIAFWKPFSVFLLHFSLLDLSVAGRWVVSCFYCIFISLCVFHIFCSMNFDSRSLGTGRSMRALHVCCTLYHYKLSLLIECPLPQV